MRSGGVVGLVQEKVTRPMGRPDCRLVPKRRRWPLRVLLALAAVLAVAAVSAASVYGMLRLSQRQVDLT